MLYFQKALKTVLQNTKTSLLQIVNPAPLKQHILFLFDYLASYKKMIDFENNLFHIIDYIGS
jgi:hypothetical protein